MADGRPSTGRTGRHIAFVNIPMHGHVYPALPVARELVRRGHRITFATVEARRAAVEATGAELRPYTSVITSETDPTLRRPAHRDFLPYALLKWVEEIEHVLPQLMGHYADDRPDLVVYDASAHSGKVLAAVLGLPSVQQFPYLPPSEQWSVAQNFNAFDPTHPMFLRYARRVERLLRAQGLDWGGLRPPVEPPTVVFVPRRFQPAADAYPDHYHFVGPCLEPRAGYDDWTPPAGDRPLLYATLGTVYNADADFYRACAAAFADEWHVVLGVGPRVALADLDPLPPGVEAWRNVPQLAVLAHAKVFVSHAGMGGLMEALSNRVPLVCVPQTPEQEANAHQVVELGLGVQLAAEELTVPALRAAVAEVTTDPAYARRVAAFAAELAAAGGTTRAADVVEGAMLASTAAADLT